MWQRKRGRRLERTKQHFIYIGDELVVQGILSRLPAKSLLRFRCVCKSWNSLISTPQFISSQLRNCRINNPQALLHQCDLPTGDGRPAAIRLLHVEDNRDQSLLLDFGFESPDVHLRVVGSAKGLICYVGVQDHQNLVSKFIIFNPDIVSFVSVLPPLPALLYGVTILGFGFDDSTLDYIIFLAKGDGCVYLYSLKSSSWRISSCQISWRFVPWDFATFVKDCFHWLTYEVFDFGHHMGIAIMVFDIKTETCRQILFPEDLLGRIQIIAGFDESSIGGVVQYIRRPRSNLIHVWSMDQNGSWFKIVEDVKVDKRSEAKEVLGFRNKNELIIRLFSRRVIGSQNIKNKEFRDVTSTEKEGCSLYSVHTHACSLTLLDKIL